MIIIALFTGAIFFVNTKTGEKSGEMLATVKLGQSRRRSDRRILLTIPATVSSVVGFSHAYFKNFGNDISVCTSEIIHSLSC